MLPQLVESVVPACTSVPNPLSPTATATPATALAMDDTPLNDFELELRLPLAFTFSETATYVPVTSLYILLYALFIILSLLFPCHTQLKTLIFNY